MSQRYPPEVHQFIRENVAGRSVEELAAMTNAAFGTNFTKETMKSYKGNHKLKNGLPARTPKGRPSKQYPAPIAEFIRNNYLGVGPKKLTEMVNEKFGTDYSRKQITSYCKNHGLNSGLTGQFQKGNVSHNKGKKGLRYPGSEKGHFKKGHTPANKRPIGTILTKADGYLWKKIGEGARDWKQLHILIWEEANGPVPDGCLVTFKDGDPQHCVLDNLIMVTRGENAVMNKNGLRPENPEYMESAVLIAKIKIAANKRKKEV